MAYRIRLGSALREGFVSAIPIFLGYSSASLAFGILASSAGLTLWQACAFSAFNFTGAAQFMAVNLIAAGVPSFEIIFSFTLVNFRYFLMSSSLQPRLESKSILTRCLLAFGVTDENYSVASLKEGMVSTPFMAALQITTWSGWLGGTVFGFLAGNLLPPSLQGAVGGSLYALFIALLVPEIKKAKLALFPALGAGLFNSVLVILFGFSLGWGVVLSMVLFTMIGAYIKTRKEAGNE